MASEKLQQIMNQIIKDCLGAYNMTDDIMIIGRIEEEHDVRLMKVIQHFTKQRSTVNENHKTYPVKRWSETHRQKSNS